MTASDGAAAADDLSAAAAIPLREPRDGVPAVVETPADLARVVAAFTAGTGPVAVDAERASGYRYSARAYLVQLRREGAGIALIDPIALPDLGELGAAIRDAEWVLHAANQDLPSLAEVGLVPRRIFDTELAGRLAGFERVGLATMVERILGHGLEKEHSAVDWSRRPLPEPWLRYAALDVELLVELRDHLETELDAQGKLEWARQEFAAVLAAPPPAPRAEPWRRTSGIHRLRNRRQLAAVRALWQARDEIARARDTAPGRILPDAAIVTAALAMPQSEEALAALPGYGGRATRRLVPRLWRALSSAARLPDSELPRPAGPSDAPPPANRWADRDPVAAGRLARVRERLVEIASDARLPVENLLTPDTVRRLAWTPPDPVTDEAVAAALERAGARAWQVSLTASALADALTATDAPQAGAEPA